MPAPEDGETGRKLHLLPDKPVCFREVTAQIAPVDVDIHVAREHSVLIANHGRARHFADVCHLRQRYLSSAIGRGNQHAFQRIHIRAEIALITDIDRIPLAPVDHGCDIVAAERIFDSRLSLLHGEAVAGQLLALPLHIEKKTTARAFSKDTPRAFNFGKQLLDLRSDFLDGRQIVAGDLQSHRRA